MKRIIIGISVFTIILISGVALYLNNTSWTPYRCKSVVNANLVYIDGENLDLNLNVNMITTHEGKSEWLVVGSVKGRNIQYIISRRVFLSTRESGFKGLTRSMITREEHQPIDNIPNDIWQRHVLPEVPGVAFYMEMKRLDNNLLFVKGLTNPFFICAINEN